MEYKTKQKDLVINYLEINKDYAISAIQIVKDLSSSVSKATIYRYLDLLVEENKVRKFFNNESNMYEYQICSENNSCLHHLHLKCIKCGKIIHLHCPSADKFLSHIEKEHSFSITPSSNTLYGLCKECSIIKGE